MADVDPVAAAIAQEQQDANAANGVQPGPTLSVPKLEAAPAKYNDAPALKMEKPVLEPGGAVAPVPEVADPVPLPVGPGTQAGNEGQGLESAPAGADPLALEIKKEQEREDELQTQLLDWRARNETTDAGVRADVLRYSAASGFTPDFVEKNLDQVKKKVDADKVDWALVAHRQPALTQFLLENPQMTPLVKDDAAELGGVEWAIRAPFHAFLDALNEQRTVARQFAEVQGTGSQENRDRIEGLEKEFSGKDYGAQNFFTKGMVGAARMIPFIVGDSLARVGGGIAGAAILGGTGAAGGAAAGTPAVGVGAVPGAATGAAGGALTGVALGQFVGSGLFNYYESVGPMYWRLSKLKDSNGNSMDPEVARAFAQGAAVVTGGLMAGFMGKIGAQLPGVKQLLAKVGGQSVEKALVDKTVGEALKAGATSFGKHWLTGATMMASQSALNAAAEESAKSVGSKSFEVHWSNVGAAATEGFKGGLQDMWLISALGPGREMLKDIGRARASAESSARLESMTNSANSSKLLERFPEGFQKAVEEMKSEKGAVESVFVPADEWAAYWQAQKLDPSQVAGAIVGDGGKSFAEALTTKGDLAIPVEKYLSKLAKTEHAAGLAEHSKLRADELTPRQHVDEQKRLTERMKEQAKLRSEELDKGKTEVHDFIRDQAEAAGLGKEEAKANAKLVSEFAGAMALRLGVSVQEAANLGALGQLRVLGPKGEAVAAAAREKFREFLRPEASKLLKDRLETLSPEGRAREVFVDPNTGLLNEKAFAEVEPDPAKPMVGHISVEGIKYLNDNVSHDRADLLYRAVAKVLHEQDPNAAKVGGDFAVRVKDAAELKELVRKVNEALPVKGFEVTGEAGADFQGAGDAHKQAKIEAETAGKRAPRAAKPLGLQTEPGAITFPEERAKAEVPKALSDRIGGLSDKEYFNEAYVEQKTGLLTQKGWEAIPRKAHVASVDLKGLKLINEKFGEKGGDAALRRFGELAAHFGGSSFDFTHLHGDEYAAQHNDPLVLSDFLARLKKRGENVGFEAITPDGEEITTPLEFRQGIGKGSYEAADRELNAGKQREKDQAASQPGGRTERQSVDGNPDRGAPGVGTGDGRGGVVAEDEGSARQTGSGRGASRQGFGEEVVAHVEGTKVTLEQPAWHGSPHKFEKFTLQKIGTGEGNQAFGWGLYFAGKKDVAEYYRRVLSKKGDGQVYKVEVPDDHELLNYDAPLTEQNPAVLEKLKSIWNPEELKSGQWKPEDVTGAFAYDRLVEHFGEKGASEALQKAGIPGLRYLDSFSRGKTEGTHNYVIWDDGRVNVTDTLYQPPSDEGGQRPRGSIQMQLDPAGKPRSFDIQVLAGDKSTFLHETAHFLSWSLHDIASSDLATADVAKDYAGLLEWAGYASPAERITETKERAELAKQAERTPEENKRLKELSAKEERISHGWEQYLLEGKAPSQALAKVFSRFKGWLTNIYRGMKGLEQQYRTQYGQELGLSDEVRGIFDRMLAQNDAVSQAMKDTGALETPDPSVTAAMSPSEREDYRRARAGANLSAEQETARRAAEIQNHQVGEERARIAAGVAEELDSQPAYRAMRYLQFGDLTDESGKPLDEVPKSLLNEKGEPYKLNRKAFVEAHGADAARRMPPGSFDRTKKGGVEVDQLAPLLGFEDGDHLVQEFTKAEPRDKAIARQTQERLDALYGPALQNLQDAAMSAVHNTDAARVQLLELRALAKEVDPSVRARIHSINLSTLKDSAARMVAESEVGTVDPSKYARIERATALKAAELWGRGEKEKSLEQREARLFNQLLYRAARDASEDLGKAFEKMEKTSDAVRANLGKADPSYRDVHDQVLAAIGIGEAPAEGLGIDALLKRADEDDQQVAFDVDAIRKLIDDPRRWESLTIDQARDVADAITNIRHIARKTNEVDAAGVKQTKDAWFKEMGENLTNRNPLPPVPFDRSAQGVLSKARGLGRGADALLTDVAETYSHMLDVGNREGPVHRVLVDARLEAKEKSAKMQRDVLSKIFDKWESVPKDIRKLIDKRVDVGELLPVPPGTENRLSPVYTRSTLWSLFLNWGNEGNRQRIRDGQGWSDDQVTKALGLLSKPELKFLQGVLDTINSLYPDIAAAHENRTGLKLGKVESTPIVINGEEYAGGYFPLKYRSDVSRAGELQEGDVIKSLFAPNYVRPVTAKGHTKARLDKVNSPVDLSWGVVPSHLSQVIHDISYGNWVRQTGGLLLDPRFKETAIQFLGIERQKQFVPWLRDVANAKADSGSAASSDALDKLGGFARNRAAVAVMGGNLPAIISQVLDPWNALQEDVPARQVAAAYVKVNASMMGLTSIPEFALSKELAQRDAGAKDNIRSKLGEVTTPGKSIRRVIDHMSFALYELSDRYTTRVTWKAAFDAAQSNGLAEEAAAKRADDVVRRTYASADIAEKPPIMRTKRGVAALVMFYSFANRLYNSSRRQFDTMSVALGDEEVDSIDKTRAVAKFAAKLLMMGATGAAVGYLGGRGPKKDEDRLKWLAWKVALEPFNTVPMLGGIMEKGLAGQKVSVRTAPELALIQDTINGIGDSIAKNESEAKIWAAVDALMLGAGTPVGQVRRTRDYVRKVEDKESRPRGPLDVAGGLLYGEKRDQTANPLTDLQTVVGQ